RPPPSFPAAPSIAPPRLHSNRSTDVPAEGSEMYVVKRDGRHEAVHFDKITARLKKLSYGLSQEHCDPVLVAQKVCAGVYKGVTTSQLDELAAETAAAMTSNHPDYASVIPASCSSSLNLRTLFCIADLHLIGAFAVYLEPWHADIYEFLELRKNHGKEEHRARDLFYALWIPDLFMERVQSNGQWSLVCLNEHLYFYLQVSAIITANLNKIIDVNYYPIETARRSNLRHRPIGIGVQGLADTFILLGMPFDSPETFDLRTVWEIKQRTLVDMAVDRGCYIDQSQSLNIHMDQPNFGKLTSLHFYAWSKGLKTGMYYLRTRAAADAIKFTVDTSLLQRIGLEFPIYGVQKTNKPVEDDDDVEAKLAQVACSLENGEACMACGS
ncbi:hypothetical protein BHE74_00054279, partial [Ensete ventricosum]